MFFLGLSLFVIPYFLLTILLIRDLGREIERAAERYSNDMERMRREHRRTWEQSLAPLERSLEHIKAINGALAKMRSLQQKQREALRRNDAEQALLLLGELEAAHDRFVLHVAAFEQHRYGGLAEPFASADMAKWLRTEYLVLYNKLDGARQRRDADAILALRAKLILIEEELQRYHASD